VRSEAAQFSVVATSQNEVGSIVLSGDSVGIDLKELRGQMSKCLNFAQGLKF